MSTPQSDQCPGCGKEITENYCAHCGEKKFRKLKMADIAQDILADGASIEIPIFKTLKGMFTRPGEVALEYVKGSRRKYYRPFQYYFMFLTIYLLVFYFMGDFEKFYAVLEEQERQWNEGLEDERKIELMRGNSEVSIFE